MDSWVINNTKEEDIKRERIYIGCIGKWLRVRGKYDRDALFTCVKLSIIKDILLKLFKNNEEMFLLIRIID